MSRRGVGLILLALASEILGLILGEWFYNLFLKTVPPLALSSFNQGAAHVAFLVYGAIAGLAIGIWSALTVFVSPMFKTRRSSASTPAV